MRTGALRGLFAVAEKYPQLKANENLLLAQRVASVGAFNCCGEHVSAYRPDNGSH